MNLILKSYFNFEFKILELKNSLIQGCGKSQAFGNSYFDTRLGYLWDIKLVFAVRNHIKNGFLAIIYQFHLLPLLWSIELNLLERFK